MTQGEQRIVEFLIAADATEMKDLPDWLLALVEEKSEHGPSRELITAASLLLARREWPGIVLEDAGRALAGYFRDPARCDELAEKISAFRMSCSLERLKRAGLVEDVCLGDPFDPDGKVSVKLTEEDWRFFNSNPTRQEVQVRLQRRWGAMN